MTASPATCYACDRANPDRIFTRCHDACTARFPEHFVGPPRSVNGGVAVGALACPALELARGDGVENALAARMTGRLRRPVPVAADLHTAAAHDGNGAIEVTYGDGESTLVAGRVQLIALAHAAAPGAVVAEPPPRLAAMLAEMADLSGREPGPPAVARDDHPIPMCFSCGPANVRGLRITPRVASERDTWAEWLPDQTYRDGGPAIGLSTLGGALDCSNAMVLSVAHSEIAGMQELVPILASMDLRVLRVPAASLPGGYRVIARATGAEGNKYHSTSALFDADGRAYAVAETVWVALPKDRLGDKGPERAR